MLGHLEKAAPLHPNTAPLPLWLLAALPHPVLSALQAGVTTVCPPGKGLAPAGPRARTGRVRTSRAGASGLALCSCCCGSGFCLRHEAASPTDLGIGSRGGFSSQDGGPHFRVATGAPVPGRCTSHTEERRLHLGNPAARRAGGAGMLTTRRRLCSRAPPAVTRRSWAWTAPPTPSGCRVGENTGCRVAKATLPVPDREPAGKYGKRSFHLKSKFWVSQ